MFPGTENNRHPSSSVGTRIRLGSVRLGVSLRVYPRVRSGGSSEDRRLVSTWEGRHDIEYRTTKNLISESSRRGTGGSSVGVPKTDEVSKE